MNDINESDPKKIIGNFVGDLENLEHLLPDKIASNIKVYEIKNNPEPAPKDFLINYNLYNKSIQTEENTLLSISGIHIQGIVKVYINAHDDEDLILDNFDDFAKIIEKILKSDETKELCLDISGVSESQEIIEKQDQPTDQTKIQKINTSSYYGKHKPRKRSRNYFPPTVGTRTASYHHEVAKLLGINEIDLLRSGSKVKKKNGKSIVINIPAKTVSVNDKVKQYEISREELNRYGYKIRKIHGKNIEISGPIRENIPFIQNILQQNSVSANTPKVVLRLTDDANTKLKINKGRYKHRK